jgi:hypothetical protein
MFGSFQELKIFFEKEVAQIKQRVCIAAEKKTWN